MFISIAAVVLLVAAFCRAAPTPQTGAPVNDTNILNFALSLEDLENAFYAQALGQFDEQAFKQAGFPSWVRGRYSQIASHEATHVEFLRGALGNESVQPCNYSFPYTDPASFVALSMALEGVGAAAYTGAAPYVDNKTYLLAAASIGETEARHNSWITSAVLYQQPWDGPFETPLTFSGAYSLAVPFITQCPDTNPPLPVMPFPALNVSNAMPMVGDNITLTFNASTNDTAKFAWYSGLNTTFTPIVSNMTVVPDALLGTVYGGVVSNDSTAGNVTMETGLAIFSFPIGPNVTEGA